jgi:hypothetical protein
MFPYLTIFLAGEHKTAHAKKKWSEADLDTVLASTVLNGADKIPFTAQRDNGTHPADNLPIFGWADKSTLRKATVDGVPALQIQPCEFAEGLLEKLQKTPLNKMSVRFDGADFSLEHICFVERPAVKEMPALSDYDFSAKEGKEWIDLSADVDFADNRMPTVGEKLRSLRDWMLAKFGLDEANKAISEYGLDDLKQWEPEVPRWTREQLDDQAQRLRALEVTTGIAKQPTMIIQDYNFNEDDMKEMEELRAAQAKTSADFAAYQAATEAEKSAAKATNDALLASNAAMQKQLAEMRDAGINRDNADFVDALVRDGKVLPAERDLQVQDLNMSAKVETKINFAGVDKDMLTAKREMLAQRPVLAPLGGHIATKEKAASGGKKADFSMDTRENELKLVEAAKELASKRNIDFADAIAELLTDEEN